MSTTDLPGLSLLVGRYRLVERLGAGGMSVVWRGFDEVLGRQVAVKVLPPSVSADPSFRRRLRAEAQAAARLSHPHITNVYDYGEAVTSDGDPVPFVVMELVDGESLAGLLARLPHLPWHVAVRICAQVSAALAAAHARGIVHRDVTPANVMLTPSGAKVVDFGISALIGENDIDPDGSLLGTPAYLAPERLEGGQVSPASDVYAVGLLIYRALIGQLPWDVGTTTALLRAHQYTEPEPLPAVPGMPRAVNALVGRCLEKHPDDRPSSAELAVVLADISAAGPPAHPSSWTEYGQDTTILPPRAERAVSRPVVAAPPTTIRPVSAPPGSAPPSAAPPSAAPPAVGVPVPRIGVPAAASAGAVWSGVLADTADGDQATDPPAASSPAPRQPPGPDRAPDPSPVGAPAAAAPAPGQAVDAATPAFVVRPGAAINGIPRNSRFGASRDNAVRPVSGQPAGPPHAGAAQPAAGGSAYAASGSTAEGRPSAAPAVADRVSADHLAARIRPPTGPVRAAHHEHLRLVPVQRSDEPVPAAMGAGPVTGSGRRGASVAGGRRLSLMLGAVLVVGALGYGFTTYQGEPASDPQAAPTAFVPSASRRCVVTYGIQSHTSTTFLATMTVTNRSLDELDDWELRFLLRGDQVMTGIGGAQLSQQNRDVTIRSTDAIGPNRTVVLPLKGSFHTSNELPVEFDLSGVACNVYVSATPGATPKKVQRTSDGRVTLVAQAPGTPVPGLTSGPAGYVPVRGGTGSTGTNDPAGLPSISPVGGPEPVSGSSPEAGSTGSPATTGSPSSSSSSSHSAPPEAPPPVNTNTPTPVDGTSPPASSSSPETTVPTTSPVNPPPGRPGGPGLPPA